MKRKKSQNPESSGEQQKKPPGRYGFPDGSITDGMTLERIVTRCGELQLDYADVILLCRDRCDPGLLLKRLADPESEASAWYQHGLAQGNLKLNTELEANVSDPKAKDAYRHLSAERRRQAVNRTLQDLFGM